MRDHGYAHVVDVLNERGVAASKIRTMSPGGWRLPSGIPFYVRTRWETNPSGQWWFTAGNNVFGSDSGYLIFVFGDVCHCAVTQVDEFAGINVEYGVYPSATGLKPTFELDESYLRLRVQDAGVVDVSHWMGAFDQIGRTEELRRGAP